MRPARLHLLLPLITAGLLLGGGCCQRPMPHPQDGEEKSAAAIVEDGRPEDLLPSFQELFEKTSPAVVNVSAAHPLPLPEKLLTRRDREILRAIARSLGSGFVFDTSGHVVTCSSVVVDEQGQPLEDIQVILSNGRRLGARLVASDDVSDLAVLSIAADQAPPPLPLGYSRSLKTGDWVAAFGYPWGLAHTITAGIVSAVRSAEDLQAAHGLILSDAAINPGCNGGPLLDTGGKVVGINLIPGQTQGSMGLAIPIEDALELLELLKSGRRPMRSWLGLSVQHVDARLARSLDLPLAEGALVSRVATGGPAEQAGIQPGDVIVSFAGRSVEDPLALIEAVRSAPAGKRTRIRVYRGKAALTLSITPRPAPF